MRKKLQKIEVSRDVIIPGQTSPLDLIRMMGGRAHKVGKPSEKTPDSMLAVYKDRLTYTFIMDHEVASIHFDRRRGEIFYKGHNIKNLELNENQREALMSLMQILQDDSEGAEFLSEYQATLESLMADN